LDFTETFADFYHELNSRKIIVLFESSNISVFTCFVFVLALVWLIKGRAIQLCFIYNNCGKTHLSSCFEPYTTVF